MVILNIVYELQYIISNILLGIVNNMNKLPQLSPSCKYGKVSKIILSHSFSTLVSHQITKIDVIFVDSINIVLGTINLIEIINTSK